MHRGMKTKRERKGATPNRDTGGIKVFSNLPILDSHHNIQIFILGDHVENDFRKYFAFIF